MKYLTGLLAFIFLYSLSLGQSFSVGISADRGNVIYTTIPNDFSYVTNVPANDIEYKINGKGKIVMLGANSFTVTVPEPGTYFISFTQKSTGTSYSFPYRAKSLPVPEASINLVSNDSILVTELRMATELNLVYESFDYNISAEVLSFSLLKISKVGDRLELENSGAMFSNEIKNLFNKSLSGDIYIFKNIKARGVDPNELDVSDMIIYVE